MTALPALAVALPLALGTAGAPPPLRVCADPNNLPFSNARGEGFENRIAELVARELGTRVEWTWRPQRRGFFRETLGANACDLVMGVPAGFERVLPTRPYYRSTYVFLSRRDRNLGVVSLDDPRLRTLRVAVQLVGDDGWNTPPAHALSRRGIVDNVVGYTLYGDYSEPDPPARIADAVARGDVDVALVWGPLAGFAARRSRVALVLSPLRPSPDGPLPFAFGIAVGVRKGAPELRDAVQAALERRRVEVDRILASYGVPRAQEPP